MKVIVCGGRDFKDRDKVFWALDFWMPRLGISMLIEGGQVSVDPSENKLPWEQRRKWGADYLAGLWADSRCVTHVREEADWKRLGTSAGPARNGRMLRVHHPQRVIAFQGKVGTADMLDQARRAGVRCIEVA